MLLIPSLSNISESILHLSHALVAQPNISLPCRSSDPLPPSPRPDFLVLLIVCPCVKCDCVWHCKCVHACICMWRLCEGGYTSMCVCAYLYTCNDCVYKRNCPKSGHSSTEQFKFGYYACSRCGKGQSWESFDLYPLHK